MRGRALLHGTGPSSHQPVAVCFMGGGPSDGLGLIASHRSVGPIEQPLDVLVRQPCCRVALHQEGGASRSSAQRWQVSSRLSSIHAAGRCRRSSIASTFQWADPKTARPSNLERRELRSGCSSSEGRYSLALSSSRWPRPRRSGRAGGPAGDRSSRRYRRDAVDEVEPPGAWAAVVKPNRLITPSTSRKRIGRTLRPFSGPSRNRFGRSSDGERGRHQRSCAGRRRKWQGNIPTGRRSVSGAYPLSAMTLQLGLLLALVRSGDQRRLSRSSTEGAVAAPRRVAPARAERRGALSLQVVHDRHARGRGRLAAPRRRSPSRRSRLRPSRPGWRPRLPHGAGRALLRSVAWHTSVARGGFTALGLVLLAVTLPPAGAPTGVLSRRSDLVRVGHARHWDLPGPVPTARATEHHGVLLAAAGVLFGVSDVAIKALTSSPASGRRACSLRGFWWR